MTEKNERAEIKDDRNSRLFQLVEIKDAVLQEKGSEQKQTLKECKNCHVEFVPCGAPETVGVEVEAKKSPLVRLFGDTPKSRILDFLIMNKKLSFSKTEISKGAKVFKTAFFKQKQGKHYYDHFGGLVRLGVVKAVSDGGRYAKYAIDTKVLKAKLKEVVVLNL